MLSRFSPSSVRPGVNGRTAHVTQFGDTRHFILEVRPVGDDHLLPLFAFGEYLHWNGRAATDQGGGIGATDRRQLSLPRSCSGEFFRSRSWICSRRALFSSRIVSVSCFFELVIFAESWKAPSHEFRVFQALISIIHNQVRTDG